MIRDLDASFTLPDYAHTIDAVLTYVRTTYGGIDHYHLAIGHSGRLIAVYLVHAYRGALYPIDPIAACEAVAPGEVVEGAIGALMPPFRDDYARPVAIGGAS